MNVVKPFEEMVKRDPRRPAIIDRERIFSATRLAWEVDRQATKLLDIGFEAGDTCLVLLRNSAEFVASIFALFKIGVVPVLVDPGMGLGRFLKVVEEVEPTALIGIPRAHALKKLSPRAFQKVRKSACWGHFPEVPDLRRGGRCVEFEPVDFHPDQMAAVLFTSGSTGPAKGVVYSHGIFCRQLQVLREVYGFGPRDVDLPGFPLFGLFSAALGVKCIVPRLDPSRPAECRPMDLIEQIHRHGVTSLQGSPAIWKRVASECLKRGIVLQTVERLITFGAPISFDFLESWKRVAPYAEIHTPYGATEALPLTDIEAGELFETRAERSLEGKGICVGRPLELNEVRVLATSSDSPPKVDPLPLGQVGEIAVRGPVVTRSYYRKPEATASTKIPSESGPWHLMGDLGYFDEHGRLWLVGRKSHALPPNGHRAEPLYPVPAESLVLPHPEIERCALVQGKSGPVLVLERTSSSRSLESILKREALALLHRVPDYREVRSVLFSSGLPVDPRHNAKIHREEISQWVQSRGL